MIRPEIKEKVDFFSALVRKQLGDNVKKIILFGSRARGDFREGSDYDFIIIVDHKDSDVERRVNSAGLEFLNRYDELAAEFLYDEEEWQFQRRFPLGINIEREGISL